MVKRVHRFIASFGGLRGRLTLTYTAVTVAALLALELLVLLPLLLLTLISGVNERQYVSDIIYTRYPRAASFLEESPPDLEGVQAWMETLYAAGLASPPPQGLFDSAAAPFAPGEPFFLLSPEGEIIAQAPLAGNDLRGRPYEPPAFEGAAEVVERAFDKRLWSASRFAVTPEGNLFIAFPVLDEEDELLAVMVLTVEPAPPLLVTWGPLFLRVLLLTGTALLIGVMPFGALFGFVMSRSLTRRLDNLAQAANAWSKGDFSVAPIDRSRDEIGRLGARLRQMAEQLQSLMQTKEELAQMEARNRIARDLHDTVKQQAFAILMQVRAARNLLDTEPESARQHLEEAEGLVKAVQQELGLLIGELRPAALDGQGLPAALQGYLETWSRYSAILPSLSVYGERPVALAIEQALYRVAQEALANVARHSNATRVEVRLRYTPRTIRLEIEDNGRGMDPAATPHGFGMETMRQRIAERGGELQISSAPGAGTRVIATVPAAGRSEGNE